MRNLQTNQLATFRFLLLIPLSFCMHKLSLIRKTMSIFNSKNFWQKKYNQEMFRLILQRNPIKSWSHKNEDGEFLTFTCSYC